MEPATTGRTSKIAAVLALVVVVVLVGWFSFAQFGGLEKDTARAEAHPVLEESQACGSCKEPKHDYKHLQPYQSETCGQCHSLISWRNVHYSHRQADFNVSMHAVIGCTACHVEGEPSPAPACEACHSDRSPHNIKMLQCGVCHTADAWILMRPLPEGHLSLAGGHADLSCFDCHTAVFAAGAPDRECVDCHDPYHGGLSSCENCHEPARGWEPLPGFDHAAFFALEGGHATVPCGSCHPNGRFAGTSSDCVDCHGVYHGGLSACNQCHSPVTGWKALPGFDHAAFFPITGKHIGVQCGACHDNNVFAGTPTDCSGCHRVVHPGLPHCGSCHTTAGFYPSTFLHSRYFAITGSHTRATCADCHPSRYDGTPTWCSGCHSIAHFGLNSCQTCHTTVRWIPSTFLHSDFPLTGGHSGIRCSRCHPTGTYYGTSTQCTSCHGVRHSGLPDCIDCHTTARWIPSTFDHSTRFALTGGHAGLACTRCHATGTYSGTPTQCTGCHGTRHGGLSACASCHTTAAFVPSTFVHSRVFVLDGAHARVACTTCHPGSRYATTVGGGGTVCGSCHAGPHGAGFPACNSCHTTTSWVPTKAIVHPGYIQLGTEHRMRTCRLCHPTLVFSTSPTPCQNCHASDVTHVGPIDCLRCHRPTTWAEVHFTHPDLPIHQAVPNLNRQCLWCHPGPDFTRFDCVTCHVDNGIPWFDPF